MAEKTCGVTGHRDIPDDQIESVKHIWKRLFHTTTAIES